MSLVAVTASLLMILHFRYVSSVLWALSLIAYIMVNVTLSYLIFLNKVHETWRIIRVVILESLILVMGIVLGICILVVRADMINFLIIFIVVCHAHHCVCGFLIDCVNNEYDYTRSTQAMISIECSYL